MNRFENMDTFSRVVEEGSISGAADRLNIAKSAVSRRLKELEEHLGVQLFHRTTRRMNLTETGHSFYQQSVRILDDVLEAELSTSKAHGTLKGNLKIALPSSFGGMHMGPAINEFLEQHPQIVFDLDFNDRQVDIIQEGFDLAIRIANLPDSSLIAKRFAPINHVLCASPEYLNKHGTPKIPEDLSKHKCLAYTLINDYKTWTFTDDKNQKVKVTIKPHMKSSAGEFLREAAVSGHGIVYAPTFMAYKEIENGKLVPLLNEYNTWQINAYAIYPQTRHLSQRVRAFVDFLAKRFEQTPYWDKCV